MSSVPLGKITKKRKRRETKEEEVRRKVAEGMRRKENAQLKREEKELEKARKVSRILKEEVSRGDPSAQERVCAAFLSGWRHQFPEGEEWEEAQKVADFRESRDYKRYMELHAKYKQSLPKQERVALGSAQRLRMKERKSAPPGGNSQVPPSPSLQFGTKIYTFSDLAGKEEAPEGRPETTNTFMMPAKGGYWKIKFIVDQ